MVQRKRTHKTESPSIYQSACVSGASMRLSGKAHYFPHEIIWMAIGASGHVGRFSLSLRIIVMWCVKAPASTCMMKRLMRHAKVAQPTNHHKRTYNTLLVDASLIHLRLFAFDERMYKLLLCAVYGFGDCAKRKTDQRTVSGRCNEHRENNE